MSHIAIILARGGSKRLPRKNILDFYGRPMVAWSIEAAKKSAIYDRILVSTDDHETAEIALKFGAEVPFLRTSAADDHASSSEATLMALLQAEEYWGESFDIVSQLMANCPLRDSSDISLSTQNFVKENVESQISCFRFGWMNPWWAAKLDDEGKPIYLFPDDRVARSQDLPPLYCPSGAIWIAQSSIFKKAKSFYSKNHIFFPINWLSAMDIDDADDYEMAKVSYQLKYKAKTQD